MVWVNTFLRGTLFQFFASFSCNLVVLSDGIQLGWSIHKNEFFKNNTQTIPNLDDIYFFDALYFIGILFSVPFSIFITKKIGPKYSLLLSCAISAIVWFAIAIYNDMEYLLLARFFFGVSSNISLTASPMYIAEISDKKIRGVLTSMAFTMILPGILIGYTTTPFVPDFVPSIIAICVISFEAIVIPCLPSSPYFLLSIKAKNDAQKSLIQLRHMGNLDLEMMEIDFAVERQVSEKGRPKDIICIPSNRKGFIITLLLNISQSLGGYLIFLYNWDTIIASAGEFYIDSLVCIVIYIITIFIVSNLSAALSDIVGRKILFVVSSILTAGTLILLAMYFTLKISHYAVEDYSWVPLLLLFVHGLVYSIGMSVVPIILVSEIYPMKIKPLGLSLNSAIEAVSTVIGLNIFYYLSNYGIECPLYLFGISCILNAIFCWGYIPETCGKSLEEIQLILKGNFMS